MNLHLLEKIDADTVARKGAEVHDLIASLTLQLETVDRERDEQAKPAAV